MLRKAEGIYNQLHAYKPNCKGFLQPLLMTWEERQAHGASTIETNGESAAAAGAAAPAGETTSTMAPLKRVRRGKKGAADDDDGFDAGAEDTSRAYQGL